MITGDKVLIIAEAGVNHNGNIDTAKRLIDAAKESGADIVKFQTFDPHKLASTFAEMAEYQKKNIGKEEAQVDMLERLALSYKEFEELAEYCKLKDIIFLSTPFDVDSIFFLDGMQNMWKIPSGEITNYPYLVDIAKTGKPIILSTGMSTLKEVEEALEVLKRNGAGEVILLHCTTDYPTAMRDVNLRAMLTLKDRFGCQVGYSDHTRGIEVPIAAVAMGAIVIEKHFTLDRNMEGPDHKASLEPRELTQMVAAIRNIETALGDGVKRPTEPETANMVIARKSIVAAKNIAKGEMLSIENLTTKRPGNGISPMKWNDIIGTEAVRDFAADEMIEI